MGLNSFKRGQATLYIIIALVVVMLISLLFIFLRPDISPDDVVPPDYQPVSNYLKTCLKESAKSSIKELGFFGGYSYKYKDDFAMVADQPTLSDGVNFPRNSDYFLPYWYHMSSPDSCLSNCDFESQVPTLEMVKNQLAWMIEEDMKSCVETAQSTMEDFEIKPKDEPMVNVTLTSEEAIFDLNYPLDMLKKGSDAPAKLSKMRVSLRAPLLKMYNIAKEITALDAEYYPFEKYVIDMIVANSDLSQDKLPPFYALMIGFHAPVFWNALDTKEDLGNLMAAYTNLFMLNGSKNYRHIEGETELDRMFWKRFALQLYGLGDFSDISYNAYFDPSWNYYFTFGGDYIAGPETIGQDSVLPIPMPLSRYVVPYDVSMPLVISLTDENALEGEGLSFNFALELNIRASEPFRSESELYGGFESMLCLPQNYQSKNYTIKVVDYDGEGVEGATVTFSSGGETCPIGKTDENGEINSRMPCGMGYISAVKKGFLSKEEPALIQPDSGGEFKITLLEEKTVKADVKKMVYDGDSFNSRPMLLDKKDMAVINLERVSASGAQDYSRALVINGSEAPKNLTLVEGDYKINGFLINMEPVTIPKKEICIGVDPVCVDTVELKSFDMNSTFLGKVVFNETNTWHYDGTEEGILNFYLFAFDSIASYDDLELLGEMDDLMSRHLPKLKPKFLEER